MGKHRSKPWWQSEVTHLLLDRVFVLALVRALPQCWGQESSLENKDTSADACRKVVKWDGGYWKEPSRLWGQQGPSLWGKSNDGTFQRRLREQVVKREGPPRQAEATRKRPACFVFLYLSSVFSQNFPQLPTPAGNPVGNSHFLPLNRRKQNPSYFCFTPNVKVDSCGWGVQDTWLSLLQTVLIAFPFIKVYVFNIEN